MLLTTKALAIQGFESSSRNKTYVSKESQLLNVEGKKYGVKQIFQR